MRPLFYILLLALTVAFAKGELGEWTVVAAVPFLLSLFLESRSEF